VADDVVLSTSHELNGGDAEDGSEEDWEDCSDCSTPNAFPARTVFTLNKRLKIRRSTDWSTRSSMVANSTSVVYRTSKAIR
jgi:hypothetical protein